MKRHLFFRRAVFAVAAVAFIGISSDLTGQPPTSVEDSIRAEVLEGLNLAGATKVAVAETYLESAIPPATRVAAKMTPAPSDTQGKYVASLDVLNGEIVILYGKQAHPELAGKTLLLTPFRNNDVLGNLFWQCGLSTLGSRLGATPIGGNTGNRLTTVDARYLPSACQQ
jgi:type IV pilus assembly protein PilA